jgi:hypothetical protein
VWEAVPVAPAPDSTVEQLKSEALQTATGRRLDPADYVVKFRGAEVLDERQTLADLDVPEGATLIVLPRRRRPVR